jgi:hypothetical protein
VAARTEFYEKLRNIGVLNADMILALEDMPLIGKKNGGEKFIVNGAYTTLDRIGEQAIAPKDPQPATPGEGSQQPGRQDPKAPPPPTSAAAVRRRFADDRARDRLRALRKEMVHGA